MKIVKRAPMRSNSSPAIGDMIKMLVDIGVTSNAAINSTKKISLNVFH
ncbi:hypothetical protein [Sporolactobacillus inulinus]|nr:hypothetical protein [Sporolactobacillus inulinus]